MLPIPIQPTPPPAPPPPLPPRHTPPNRHRLPPPHPPNRHIRLADVKVPSATSGLTSIPLQTESSASSGIEPSAPLQPERLARDRLRSGPRGSRCATTSPEGPNFSITRKRPGSSTTTRSLS